MILPPPPPPDGAEHAPPLANVTRPRSKQFVAVKPAAPDVVIERKASHEAVLAAPSDSVATVSKLFDMISEIAEDEPPDTVKALVTV